MAKRQNRCGLQAGIHMILFIVDQISDMVAESHENSGLFLALGVSSLRT